MKLKLSVLVTSRTCAITLAALAVYSQSNISSRALLRAVCFSFLPSTDVKSVRTRWLAGQGSPTRYTTTPKLLLPSDTSAETSQEALSPILEFDDKPAMQSSAVPLYPSESCRAASKPMMEPLLIVGIRSDPSHRLFCII